MIMFNFKQAMELVFNFFTTCALVTLAHALTTYPCDFVMNTISV